MDTFSTTGRPRVLIIGAGSAGIAAASRLIENGITNVIILEAENRHGGRINATKIGPYRADLGGQWVHGDVGNIVYELAAPFDLLSHSRNPGEPNELIYDPKYYGSSGNKLSDEIMIKAQRYLEKITDEFDGLEDLKTGSYGEYVETKFRKWFSMHPEIPRELHRPLLDNMELFTMSDEGGEDWNDVSVKEIRDNHEYSRYQEINWKEGTYETVLDILMKRYPNPKEELPILNNTLFNKKVSKIIYGEGLVKVVTNDEDVYTADHVIFTASLGVLKAHHRNIFHPQLPARKIEAIESLGIGKHAKILMYYENPWWGDRGNTINSFFWTESDRKEIENDPERNWMLSITYDYIFDYKPNLYALWLGGSYSENMEKIPDELLKTQILEFHHRFLGSYYNITEPTEIQRSHWNTNDNFLGTYSYPTLKSHDTCANAKELGLPVMRRGIPVLQFAGEATDPRSYSTVNAAIVSGWREADRLIKIYST